MSEAAFTALRGEEFLDYDPTLDHGGNARRLLQEYGIPESTDSMSAMLKGGTAQDQAAIAQRLALHQQDLAVLERHGALAFTASMVDPATLITDIGTWGLTRALRFGRAATGVAGATANTGLLATADSVGKEVSPFEYTVMAAVSYTHLTLPTTPYV